jgi:hypothetical protein
MSRLEDCSDMKERQIGYLFPILMKMAYNKSRYFGISSFGGKAIRKWSHELCKCALDEKRKSPSKVPTHAISNNSLGYTNSNKSKDDLIRILKLRLVKGEITEEEFNDLLRLIE